MSLHGAPPASRERGRLSHDAGSAIRGSFSRHAHLKPQLSGYGFLTDSRVPQRFLPLPRPPRIAVPPLPLSYSVTVTVHTHTHPRHIMSNSGPRTRSASCLCGAIKFDITGDPVTFMVCHCVNCQKATGSVFMSNTFFKAKVRDASLPSVQF